MAADGSHCEWCQARRTCCPLSNVRKCLLRLGGDDTPDARAVRVLPRTVHRRTHAPAPARLSRRAWDGSPVTRGSPGGTSVRAVTQRRVEWRGAVVGGMRRTRRSSFAAHHRLQGPTVLGLLTRSSECVLGSPTGAKPASPTCSSQLSLCANHEGAAQHTHIACGKPVLGALSPDTLGLAHTPSRSSTY
jgi:hypothetical protein